MKFIKDILLFDIETSGPDTDKDVVVQFSAVLLDKDNLLEKGAYHTYIKNSMLQQVLKEQAIGAHANIEQVQGGKKPLDFVRELPLVFPTPVTLASAGMSRVFFLKGVFRKQAVTFPFEMNILDLWTVYYIYGVRAGLKKIPTLHTLAEQLHMRIQNPYDANERVRLHAAFFRHLIKEL